MNRSEEELAKIVELIHVIEDTATQYAVELEKLRTELRERAKALRKYSSSEDIPNSVFLIWKVTATCSGAVCSLNHINTIAAPMIEQLTQEEE